MIQNLNQVTFQDYGIVVSERAQAAHNVSDTSAPMLQLIPGNTNVCRTMSDTWVNCGTGISVLSVSTDNETFQHFYLDKPACIKKGLYFAVAPLKGNASVRLYTTKDPENVGAHSTENLRMERRLKVDGLYTFFYQEKEQGFLFSGESHPMPELTYVDQGSLHSVVDGKETLLKQGDLVIYAPNQWHMQYADIGVAPRFVTISFDLSGVDLTPLLNRQISVPQKALSLLKIMLREQENMDEYSNDIILTNLSQLLIFLLREVSNPREQKLQTVNSAHNENEIIRQAQQYISAHIRDKLSVPLVARQVDVSPSYLTALFHKNLQISPGEYIRRIKLQESKQMIRENNLNFTEIAAALQYSTVHHFSRQFKEKFGITPTEYAKSVR